MLTILTNNVSWYESRITFSVIGFLITIITFSLAQFWISRRDKRSNKRNILNTVTQGNKELFSIIFMGSLDKSKIDYSNLTKQLRSSSSFVYILPSSLQEDFISLYKIHFTNPEYYLDNKDKIHDILITITKKLKKLGVDAIG